MKAQGEADALEHMTIQHGRGHLSGQFTAWTQEKLLAMEFVWEELGDLCAGITTRAQRSGLITVLELGVGDLSVMRCWQPFVSGELRYLGVDFVPGVLEHGRKEFPHQGFVECPFSAVPDTLGHQTFDVVVLLDVLYHIPDTASLCPPQDEQSSTDSFRTDALS